MPELYSAQMEAEAQALVNEAIKRRDEAQEECNTIYHSDAKWDAARQERYATASENLAQQRATVGELEAKLDRIKGAKPSVKNKREFPLAERFFRDGENGVTREERKEIEAAMEERSWSGTARAYGGKNANAFLISGGNPRGGIEGAERLTRTQVDPRMVLRSDDSSGSSLVDEETLPTVVERLIDFGGARTMCQSISTGMGNPMNVPIIDAASDEGIEVGAQGTDVGENDPDDFGSVEVGSTTYTSRAIRVSVELVQDSQFEILPWIRRQTRRRLGRIINKRTTTGSGTNQPQGLIGIAAEFDAANRSRFTWEELLQMQYPFGDGEGIDMAYLEGGEAGMGGSVAETGGMIGYMFNYATEGQLRLLKDGEGRPLWQAGLTSEAPDRLHGRPYVINNHMPSIGEAGAKPILFGNFAYHLCRDSADVMILQFFDSRTARFLQHEVHAYCRYDARHISPLVNGKSPAVVALTMAAADAT